VEEKRRHRTDAGVTLVPNTASAATHVPGLLRCQPPLAAVVIALAFGQAAGGSKQGVPDFFTQLTPVCDLVL
jgi:hypothetical protein